MITRESLQSAVHGLGQVRIRQATWDGGRGYVAQLAEPGAVADELFDAASLDPPALPALGGARYAPEVRTIASMVAEMDEAVSELGHAAAGRIARYLASRYGVPELGRRPS
ncbi:MAG: hypothetical protein FWE15_04685 [Actinomycetia bacterium]|nr:hypothetical protein [Actinomycetes bacterium]